MQMRGLSPAGLTAVFLVLLFCTGRASSQIQSPPQFRLGVTLVPVEVRVVDQDGAPVTDLTPTEFAIRENGRPQTVDHFQAVALEGSTAGRTFLVVLGRGRLNQPTKALQALMNFVRSQTLPQDRIGVVAYLRVIEPTTDHDAVINFLGVYRDRHEAIDAMLAADLGQGRPLQQKAMGRLRPLGTETRAAIEGVFAATLPVRDLAGDAGIGADQYDDFRYLRNSLEYLRTMDGEKHAILISERPFGAGVVENNPLKNYWFRLATAARTSLSYIHAGGAPAPTMSRGRLRPASLLSGLHPGVVAAYEVVAEQTGGLSAFFQFADKPLTALDRSTRFHYLLGYYPAEPPPPTAYRAIEVAVTRPGVRVLYRHGYVAQPEAERPEDYRQAVTDARLDMGANLLVHPFAPTAPGVGLFKWEMRLKSPVWVSSGAGGRLRVTVSFAPEQTTFVQNGDEYQTDLDCLLLADDEQRNVLGEQRLKLNIKLNARDFERTKREWISSEATMDASARPAYLRAVLYDFKQDRTASTQLRMQR
jgi:VWFA-related protein